jgi:hypothetical protein
MPSSMSRAGSISPATVVVHPTSKHAAALRGLLGAAGNLTSDARLTGV